MEEWDPPPWARYILDVYWELRPWAETQALYKSRGLRPFDYWLHELEYLTKSTWARDPSLPAYLLDKYSKDEKIRLDLADQGILAAGFIMDLGMNPVSFPIKIPL